MVRRPVADEADHIGPGLDPAPGRLTASRAGRAGHEHGVVLSKAVHFHSFHGGRPASHKLSR
jgi:hypothetical protein